mmetsp:Transcript_89061/g.229806  ORF Transcript_89061/g.229806 Transcript_89061/m.229806 type:complete len:306 (+) Transcript_89061:47-964(+)
MAARPRTAARPRRLPRRGGNRSAAASRGSQRGQRLVPRDGRVGAGGSAAGIGRRGRGRRPRGEARLRPGARGGRGLQPAHDDHAKDDHDGHQDHGDRLAAGRAGQHGHRAHRRGGARRRHAVRQQEPDALRRLLRREPRRLRAAPRAGRGRLDPVWLRRPAAVLRPLGAGRHRLRGLRGGPAARVAAAEDGAGGAGRRRHGRADRRGAARAADLAQRELRDLPALCGDLAGRLLRPRRLARAPLLAAGAGLQPVARRLPLPPGRLLALPDGRQHRAGLLQPPGRHGAHLRRGAQRGLRPAAHGRA